MNDISNINKEKTQVTDSKKGRKNNNEAGKGLHGKLSEDNIMTKIKTYILNNYIRDIIKKISKGKIDFKKFTNKFMSKLKRNDILALLEMKIANIYTENDMSSKYSTYKDNENANIIKRIYNEKKNSKIII